MEVVVNDEALVERMAEAMQQATHKPGESAFKAMARAALAALQVEPEGEPKFYGWDHPNETCGRLLVGQGDDTYDPLCRLPLGHEGPCRPGNLDPLTPEEADAVAGILGGTVALVESLRPEAQEKYKRGAWWTAYEKLRALASTGRGTE